VNTAAAQQRFFKRDQTQSPDGDAVKVVCQWLKVQIFCMRQYGPIQGNLADDGFPMDKSSQ
jgi:hypothetical protein